MPQLEYKCHIFTLKALPHQWVALDADIFQSLRSRMLTFVSPLFLISLLIISMSSVVVIRRWLWASFGSRLQRRQTGRRDILSAVGDVDGTHGDTLPLHKQRQRRAEGREGHGPRWGFTARVLPSAGLRAQQCHHQEGSAEAFQHGAVPTDEDSAGDQVHATQRLPEVERRAARR